MILQVTFIQDLTKSELYHSVTNDRYYIRQKAKDRKHAVWYIAVKWKKTYMPALLLEKDTLIQVFADEFLLQPLYNEDLYQADESTVWADIKAPFYNDVIQQELSKVFEDHPSLYDLHEWEDAIVTIGCSTNRTLNWVNQHSEQIGDEIRERGFTIHGIDFQVSKTRFSMTDQSAEWDQYLLDCSATNSKAIIGYEFIN